MNKSKPIFLRLPFFMYGFYLSRFKLIAIFAFFDHGYSFYISLGEREFFINLVDWIFSAFSI